MGQSRREQDLSARVSSGCLKKRGRLLWLCVFFFFFSPRHQKVSLWKPKASFSQTSNSPAFDCVNTKGETEEEGNESETGA